MKHIKLFEGFRDKISQYEKTYDLLDKYDIEYTFNKDGSPNIGYKIEKFTINEDGTIDIDGDVKFYEISLSKLPFKFGKVSGNFELIYIEGLISLDGCPREVGGNFECYSCNLTSLKGGPDEVGGNFVCRNNELTSLEYCPSEVGGNFYCENNKLTDIDISTNIVGDLKCWGNKISPDNYNFYGECRNIIFEDPVRKVMTGLNARAKRKGK